jgi:hypothetical protein
MVAKFILSESIALAMAQTAYDIMESGTFAGVMSPSVTLRQREEESRSAIEAWLLVGLKMGFSLPELDMASIS